MFEDSLFASTARRNPRRGWAAVLSFAMQAVVLGIFVLVPLLYTDALPINTLKGLFIVTAPTTASAPKPPDTQRARPSSNFDNNRQLVEPIQIPRGTHPIVDRGPLETGSEAPGSDIPGAIPITPGRGENIARVLDLTPHLAPSIAPPRAVRLSGGVTEGLLLHKITPVYPAIARQARIQGQVVLQATIGRDGTIQNLQVISGHPMLVPSALDAVKQWRYRPYLLNNEPVEVETQITVNFTLGG